MPDSSVDLPRVLVVSHNPFSDVQSNGKTLSTFFDGWPKDRLAQLYFTGETPDFNVCTRFFRVTDADMVKAATGRPGTAGPVRRPVDAVVEGATDRPVAASTRIGGLQGWRRWPITLMLRSAVWGRRRWASPQLESWLEDFDPDLVFFQSSNCTFAFNVVEDICTRHGSGLVMETTDDYVTATGGPSPFGRLYHRQISSAYARAVRRASSVVAIGEVMASEYAERFGGTYIVAMNSVEEAADAALPVVTDTPRVLHFAGNLGLNRWRVLLALGRALDRLQDRYGLDAELEIYSLVSPGERALEELTAPSRVTFLGAADTELLRRRRRESALLVHVESFDRSSRHATRLSVSTKIPEYLASGRCVLAVGPAEVASIRYLSDHEAGAVVTTAEIDDLADALAVLLKDTERQEGFARRGLELVRRNHRRSAIAALVRDSIVGAGRGA